MTPERWARVKEIAGAALEKQGSERAAFLDQACASEDWLRREVERLLAAHDPQSMESPLAGARSLELKPAQKFGHYQVECLLGQGGMGAVYKAWDEKLQRPVALKVMSKFYFDDAAGRQRFLREARAASALNHPNIVTIYEAGTEDGLDFIAMEYIEGESLNRLIPPGGQPLEKTLDYATAIADALIKAHSTGIIHRDLKPANVIVTREGVVKLLDFGLARRVHPGGAESTTLTREGEIFGTPAYMSPEQAEGKRADERSDIFSFGVVLYEMLSGRRAFTGDSTAAVLSAVLKDEPPPLQGVPENMERLVALCLRKDPTRRLQHMDDVRLLLEEAGKAVPKPAAEHKPRGKVVRWTAALAVAVVCACLALWMFLRDRGPQLGEMRVVPLTRLPGWEVHPSFSPDGSRVAFAWYGDSQNTDIYVAIVGSAAAPLQLTRDPASDLYPAWSPDGLHIAFARQQGLYLVSAQGGPERRLAEIQLASGGFYPNTLGWSPDGKWLAVGEGTATGTWRISLVSVERGEKRTLMPVTAVPYAPAFSPDGRRLAYVRCPNAMVETGCDLYLVDLAPDLSIRGMPRRLTEQRAYILGLAWTPDGQSVIYAASQCGTFASRLWRVRVSAQSTPQPIDLAGLGARYPAVSRSGQRLAYSQGPGYDIDIWRFQAGAETPRALVQSTGIDNSPQFSPDGRRIAFASNRSTGCPEIWVADRDGTNALQLTNDLDRFPGTPRWSPDGRWIAFDEIREDGHADVAVMDSDGGQRRRLTAYSSNESVPSWSRDGKWVYFRSDRTGRNEIWKIPFEDGEAIQVTDNGGYVAFESVDGNMLYYLKSPSLGPLFARPTAGGPESQIISDGIHMRAFYPVQNGIYYITVGQDPTAGALKFHSLATRHSNVITKIEGARWLNMGLAVSPDDKTFLFSKGQRAEADLMLIENFR